MNMHERTELLIGKQNLEKLKSKHVIVFGVGGVGGYVCEMLARSGVGSLTIVDFDVVSKSNLNRQIIALNSTIGKTKVDVMKARLLDINPDLKVIALNKMFDKANQKEFNLAGYDYVVDAIDTVMQKISLIVYAKKNNANIISSMGTGNRSAIPHFMVSDVFETTYDGLARKIRNVLRKEGISNHLVVSTNEKPEPNKPVGSIVYYPAMCGSVVAAKLIQELTKD